MYKVTVFICDKAYVVLPGELNILPDSSISALFGAFKPDRFICLCWLNSNHL